MTFQEPDFARIAKVASTVIQKDGRHTLTIFSAIGIGIIVYGWFNPEYKEGLMYGGVFFLMIGLGRFLVEKYKRPYLMVACIKKKEAIPYARIPGTFDFFFQIEVAKTYALQSGGQAEISQTELEQRIKVSAETFANLNEGDEVMMLFSSTRMFLGIITVDYRLLAN